MSHPPDMSPSEVHAACDAKITAQATRIAELEKVIKDFACDMAISYSDPRLRYYELQVACSAYDDFKAFAAALTPEEPK